MCKGNYSVWYKDNYFLDDKYANSDGVKSSKRMFDSAGVKYKKFKAINKEIKISL